MTPDELLAQYAPIRRETADALRALVKRTIPDAIERVRPGWALIGYDLPIGKRTAYFAFVWAEPEHVHLGFEHGSAMEDPDSLLRGRDLKKVRFVTLAHPGEIPNDVLVPLIREAARVAAMTRSERVAVLFDREDRTGSDLPRD